MTEDFQTGAMTLSDAEKGYLQLKKEALSIVRGVKKFQYYLEGGLSRLS